MVNLVRVWLDFTVSEFYRTFFGLMLLCESHREFGTTRH
jgi:hypothetical protein